MTDPFAALLALQDLDVRLDGIRARLAALEAGEPLRATAEDLEKTTAALERRSRVLQQLERQAQREEAEARELRAERERVEARLYGGEIASVKEMEKMQERIRYLAETADSHELAALEAMEKAEELRPVVARLKARRERLEGEVARIKAEIETEIKELRRQEEDLAARVDPARAAVPAKLLSDYDFHRRRRGGDVVAAVDGDRCTGCSVVLPVALLSRVKKRERLETCENCGRLLVWLGG